MEFYPVPVNDIESKVIVCVDVESLARNFGIKSGLDPLYIFLFTFLLQFKSEIECTRWHAFPMIRRLMVRQRVKESRNEHEES